MTIFRSHIGQPRLWSSLPNPVVPKYRLSHSNLNQSTVPFQPHSEACVYRGSKGARRHPALLLPVLCQACRLGHGLLGAAQEAEEHNLSYCLTLCEFARGHKPEMQSVRCGLCFQSWREPQPPHLELSHPLALLLKFLYCEQEQVLESLGLPRKASLLVCHV